MVGKRGKIYITGIPVMSKSKEDMSISEEAWKTAHYYLDGRPDGTKLPYTAIKGDNGSLIPRIHNEHFYHAIDQHNMTTTSEMKLSQTTNSFIKINNTIFAILPGKENLSGATSTVKWLINEKGEVFIDKIMRLSNSSLQENEVQILEDREELIGNIEASNLEFQDDQLMNNYKEKLHTSMNYRGKTLADVFQRPPDEDSRLNIAINLCLEVDDLHRVRSKSKSRTPYAHLDIKMDNITWDTNKQIHLIDFGFSEKNINDIFQYNVLGFKGTNEQYDIFRLKKVLFLEWEDSFGLMERTGILSLNQVNGLGLRAVLAPESEKITACTLAAILIADKFGLSISKEELIENPEKSMAISALYLAKRSMEEINLILDNPQKIQQTAAFYEMNKTGFMRDYMKDTDFASQIQGAKSYEHICALIHLKTIGFHEQYENLHSDNVTKALYFITKYPLVLAQDLILVSSIIHDSEFTKTINALEDTISTEKLQKLIYENPAYINMKNKMESHSKPLIFEPGNSSVSVPMSLKENEQFASLVTGNPERHSSIQVKTDTTHMQFTFSNKDSAGKSREFLEHIMDKKLVSMDGLSVTISLKNYSQNTILKTIFDNALYWVKANRNNFDQEMPALPPQKLANVYRTELQELRSTADDNVKQVLPKTGL